MSWQGGRPTTATNANNEVFFFMCNQSGLEEISSIRWKSRAIVVFESIIEYNAG